MAIRSVAAPLADRTTPKSSARRPARVSPAPGWGVLGAALLLSGCAGGLLSNGVASGGNAAQAAPAMPLDPVIAFAATAAPGAVGQVVLANSGRPARVRLLRSYHAGSGRECREVLVGSGQEERATLACQDGVTWAATRPLLGGRGSGPR